MKKNLKTFDQNLNKNAQTIKLTEKFNTVGMKKYFPSFTKEWKNSIYSFNVNNIKNLTINDFNINKIIKSYFDLYIKNNKSISRRFISLRKRRKLLRRIYLSNVEIKHTNLKSIITLYVYNKERFALKKLYLTNTLRLSKMFIGRFFSLYYKHLSNVYKLLDNQYKNNYFFAKRKIDKKSYLNHKLNLFMNFLDVINLYKKKYEV